MAKTVFKKLKNRFKQVKALAAEADLDELLVFKQLIQENIDRYQTLLREALEETPRSSI
jgi:hypothetical protein